MIQAIEAERSVLGGIFLDNKALDIVSSQLNPEDFQTPQHQSIFTNMLRLVELELPIDPVTMASSLAHEGILRELGGIDYLLSLAGCTASTVNIEHHAGLVKEAADLRRLLSLCQRTISRLQEGNYEESEKLFDDVQQEIYGLGKKKGRRDFIDMPSALNELTDKLEAAYKAGDSVTGVPSGFEDLDAITSGFQPVDLIILAARPAMGKTALALNIAVNAMRAEAGSVALFSLEMPAVQLASRMASVEGRIDGHRMRDGQLSPEEINAYFGAQERLKPLPLFIGDTLGLSLPELRAKCRRLASNKSIPPLAMVIIDYLQLMKGPKGGNREQEISSISRGLKGLAKELNVPIIALSQLNRGLESRADKRPMLSDLRESGSLEQDADLVLFIYRHEVYHPDEIEHVGKAELIVSKNRNGAIGMVPLKFTKQWTEFRSAK